MIPNTVLMKQVVANDPQRDAALQMWCRIMTELGMEEALIWTPPFQIEVIARAALGGKTEVITTITREFKRS